MLRAEEEGLRLLLVGSVVGVVEEPQPVFQLQHPGHSLVDLGFGECPFLHQLLQVVQVGAGAHLNVAAVLECQFCRLLFVFCDTVHQQLPQGVVVADDHALVIPLVLQNLFHQPGVGHGGNAVHGVEGGHQQRCAGIDAGLVGGQEVFPQLPLRALHQVVVPPRLHAAVARIVLDAGGQVVIFLQILPLEALHLSRPQVPGQHGVFAAGLHHPSPPGVPAVVHHGGEGDLHAAGSCLPGGHLGTLLRQCRVKGAAQPQGDGEDGAVAVDHIHHKKHGNFVGVFR